MHSTHLFRTTWKQASTLHARIVSRSRPFSSLAFEQWNVRLQSLCARYPRLFDADAFLQDQAHLLEDSDSQFASLLQEYDQCRDTVNTAAGEDIFPAVSVEARLTTPASRFEYFDADSADMQSKLAEGESLIAELLALQNAGGDLSEEQANLRMVAAADFADRIDAWQLSLLASDTSSASLGLPIADDDLDAWVAKQYYHAPDAVREQGNLSYEEHKKVEEAWMAEVDERLQKKLKSDCAAQGRAFDENEWMAFCTVANDIFHPHNIDHYALSNASKCLFRAALWQSSERPAVVEESIIALRAVLSDNTDNDIEIVRKCAENSPGMPLAPLIALQLQMTDPLFAAKLCVEASSVMEKAAFERAVNDVMRKLELPAIEAELRACQEELRETLSSNPASLQRQIARLQVQMSAFDRDVPELAAVLDDLLPRKLWASDISRVKEVVLAYAAGDTAITLANVSEAIYDCLLATANGDVSAVVSRVALSDADILDLSVKYHNARTSNPEWWNTAELLVNVCNEQREIVDLLSNQRRIRQRFASSFDPLVTNLLCVLFVDGNCTLSALESLVADYLTIMRRFRGEVDATVTSAHELDEHTLSSILMALENANPSKKITLAQVTDAGVQAGFVVKAGVQRFDLSLSTAVQQAFALT